MTYSSTAVINVPPPREVKPPPPTFKDPCSYSDPSKLLTHHIHLNLHIDLQRRLIISKATYTIRVIDPTEKSITLDIRAISITSITDPSTNTPLPYKIHKPIPDAATGDALTISLPVIENGLVTFCIQYETDGLGGDFSCGGACQWLHPKQASGNPFIFTQCQSIHARSVLPCQDTPAAKSTYSALVTIDEQSVKDDLQVVMSAIQQPLEKGDAENSWRFNCPVPVPSYLIAFAVGKLESRNISNRCKVWALPDVIKKAHWEFEHVEQFLKTAEGIAGDYVWGRYDILVLPSSFCYGGMENPMLTFVTPTLLSGDRSLVSVVIHEIAHSWTGNLVSCQDTCEFWMNEGFTVKLERRILRELYGSGREGLDAISGRNTLNEYIKRTGSNHKYTSLVTKLEEGDDPDDYYSCVAYEKGYNFLLLLEEYVQHDYNVDISEFFKDYYQRFSYQAISSSHFVEMFKEYYPKTSERIDFDEWIYGTGYCPQLANVDSKLVEQVEILIQRWITCFKEDALMGDEKNEFLSWDACQKLSFLSGLANKVMREDWWNEQHVLQLEETYKLNGVRNSEMRFWWCRLGVAAKWHGILDNVVEFVKEQGRMKFVRPLFRDLSVVYPCGDFAVKLFEEVTDSYHSLSRKMIQRDLNIA